MTSEVMIKSQMGMQGLAHIELEANKESKTIIKNLQVEPPLLIQKAIYHDQRFPKTAQIYLMSSAGGILQGDQLKIKIAAGKNTNAFITTQAATKIYKSENQISSQLIEVGLDRDSYIEFLPQQIIPHKSARFYQDVNFHIDDSATMLYSETISAGRIAHGEKFDFDSLVFRLNVQNAKNELLFSEAINVEPQNKKEKFKNLFGNKNLYSSIFIISKKINSEKLDNEIFNFLKTKDMMSCSQLPNDAGVVVRILTDDIDEIVDVTLSIRKIVKNHITKLKISVS